MAKVPVELLKAGMRLSRPLTNKQGVVILGQGAELTDGLITKLSGLGIRGAFIKGMSEPSVPKERMLEMVDQRFKTVEGDPSMDLLKQVTKTHIEELYESA